MKKHTLHILFVMIMVLATFTSIFSVNASAFESEGDGIVTPATDAVSTDMTASEVLATSEPVTPSSDIPEREAGESTPSQSEVPATVDDLLATVDYAMELVADKIIEVSSPRTVLLFILASLLSTFLLVCLLMYTVMSSMRRRRQMRRERRAARRAEAAQQP